MIQGKTQTLRRKIRDLVGLQDFQEINSLLREIETELISLRKNNIRYLWKHGPLEDPCVPEMIEFEETSRTPCGVVSEEIHDG